jgi:hypothetical protein
MPTATCPLPDQESSQERSAWSARSYEGIGHPGKPTAAGAGRAGRASLLDDVIGLQQQRLRDREADLPGGAEIEGESDLVVVLDR